VASRRAPRLLDKFEIAAEVRLLGPALYVSGVPVRAELRTKSWIRPECVHRGHELPVVVVREAAAALARGLALIARDNRRGPRSRLPRYDPRVSYLSEGASVVIAPSWSPRSSSGWTWSRGRLSKSHRALPPGRSPTTQETPISAPFGAFVARLHHSPARTGVRVMRELSQ